MFPARDRSGLAACAACLLAGGVWAAEGTRPITLAEAVEQTLAHNLDLALQREAVIAAEARVLQAEGAFDPEWSGNYAYSEETRSLDAESATAAGGLTRVRSEAESASIGLGGLFPFSTRYAASLRDRGSADTFNDFEQEHTASAGLTLTQPLLRGRGPEITRVNLRIARRGLDLSFLEFRRQVEAILLQLEHAYWDLQRAHRDLEVRRKSVQAAESLVQQVQARLEAQTASEADRVQAESGLAQRRIALLESRRALELQDRVLKDLLLPDLATPAPLLAPTDEPALDLALPAQAEVLARAEANRPEFARTALQIANAEDQLAVVRDNRRPQVDLEGSVGVNGLGGSFGSAIDDGRNADNNSWSLGVVLRTPWPNRKARGALAEQEAALRQQLIQARQTRRQVHLEVGEIYDRLKSSAEQLAARRIAVDFARLSLRNEEAKYEVQQATVHDLLLLETELLEAELGLYQVTADHRKHQATLRQVMGTLLNHWHITLADTPAPTQVAP